MSSANATVSPAFHAIEELARDEHYHFYRADGRGGRGTVLVKAPLAQSRAAVAALKREFEILSALPVDGITRALDFVDDDLRCELVLEDPGATTLAALVALDRPQLGWILDCAIDLVGILAELHRCGVIHRGLNPHAVLVTGRSGGIRLTDFSEAARDSAEACLPLPQDRYGTRLAYAAPEQTGRVNRVADYRTDFYALGVLLYELVTGRLPFPAADPLELIHGHVAKLAPPPSEVDPAVPRPVSAIVMKLLDKEAEQRYQSARCVERDLRRCRDQWLELGEVEPFEIAVGDVSERFAVPKRVYGREREMALAWSLFERARAGATTLLLVAGNAGVGKTALIRELGDSVVRSGGRFVSGKFDQITRDIPYSALIEAFRQLIQRLLAETSEQLECERGRLRASLGANAAVIADVIPEIELVLGSQFPSAVLPPAEAQNRFMLTFERFVAALATPEHPLVVFVDDLQWVDPATLQLVAALLASLHNGNLMLVGAYRDNEVGAGHRLGLAIEALEAQRVPMQRVTLSPLALPALTELTADTIHASVASAGPLAALLQAKTDGNPFFVTQFLTTLHREGVIFFDFARSQWSCRLDAIAGVPMTDNAIDLVSRRIERLAPATRHLLALAACLGGRFDPQTLATIGEQPLDVTLSDLAEATAEGLVVPQPGNVFAFVHDRVQQAAYAGIGESRRPEVHLSIGRVLFDRLRSEGAEEAIFDAASHLNLGMRLIESPRERRAAAELNLGAGRKAKQSAAYPSALSYFHAGIALQDEANWHSDYELAFELRLEAAQCQYLCGDFDASEQAIVALLLRARTALDRARVHRLRMVQFENLSRYEEALACASEALALLGFPLPASPQARRGALDAEVASIRGMLGERAIASLIDLPPMVEPGIRMVMGLLTDIWSSAYILGDAVLARLLSAMLVRLSLEHGNCAESAYGYVTHAITVGPVLEDYASAYEFGKLALDVNERFRDAGRRAKIFQQFHAHVALWREPMQGCIPYAKEACRSGLESGDFLYAAYGAATESWPAFVSTQDLGAFISDFAPNLALIERLRNASFSDALKLMLGWARALRGETRAPQSLTGAGFDEDRYVSTYGGNPFFSMFHAIAKMQLAYALEEYGESLAAGRRIRPIANQLIGMMWSVLFDFWYSLALAANFSRASRRERRAWLEDLRGAQRRLAVLAESCPDNFLCPSLLVAAEVERVSGDQAKALTLFEQAVDAADRTGSVQHQALANELAGKFRLARGSRRIAALHLRSALRLYEKWGAHAKVRSLVERHGEALGGPDDEGNLPVPAPQRHDLDVATIVKAAHAIVANVERDELLRQLLRFALENAGARRAVLIEDREGALRVAAEGLADTDEVVLLHDTSPATGSPRFSSAIVNYVHRTSRRLVIPDATVDERFAQDAYVVSLKPRSILCLPIVHQGKLVAILYLENSLVRDAFGPERIEIVEIVSAQAAISLENARLASRMKRETQQRERAQETLRAIEAGTATVTGGDFFRALVRNLARALNVRTAFVAECFAGDNGGRRAKIARTRAFWHDGDFGADFEYALPGTPCEAVLEGELCHHQADVQSLFPADRDLVAIGAQSYVGIPLMGSSGKVIGHMAILDMRPMTDPSTAISVLKLSAGRAGAELERLMAEERLRGALEEVERLKNRLQDENVYLRRELIANVAHDLRSPLASLRGYLETLLLKEKALAVAERRSYLRIAVRQAERLQTLIAELFELAKLDFQGYQISAEPVHLGELARDVLQKFQLGAQKRHVELMTDIEPAVELVRADMALIERTLENLIDNALAQTPSGGSIRVAVFARGERVTLRVSDTGRGIPAADLPRIFERFYQVDKARTRTSSGSGLGLAIVKRIVELHASEIQVESAPGIGTSFWFSLPAARAHACPDANLARLSAGS